jgi:hypothetical protein
MPAAPGKWVCFLEIPGRGALFGVSDHAPR